MIKRIQALRKTSGFEITDRVNVVLEKKPEFEKVLTSFGEHIASQVLANSITLADDVEGSVQDFGEFEAKLSVKVD